MHDSPAQVPDEHLRILLHHDPIDVQAAVDFAVHPAAGAIDVFLGTTRRWTGDRETVELAYEAYEPMARSEMCRLAERARARWPVLRVCIVHRLGVVPVGEASVVIAVATAHRAAAFEACRWLIDTLKQQVPIWKREHYSDGGTEWVEGSSPPAIG